MRALFNCQSFCSRLGFLHIGLVTAISLCSLLLTNNPANAADSGLAREADAAFNVKDYTTALSKYSQLAKEGNAAAQFNVGVFYLKGLGTQKDDKQAYDWFKKSALNGYANAKKLIESGAAKGNIYASDALKELQPPNPAQTPVNALPAKAETVLADKPPQAPIKPVVAESTAETTAAAAPAKESGNKSNSALQGKSNQNSSNSSVQNMYVVFDLGKVNLKNLSPSGSDPSSSYRIAGGYKIFANAAVEVGYLKTGTGSYASAAQNSLNVSSIQVSAVFNYRLFGALDLLGRVGLTSNTTGGDAVSTCNCATSKTLLYGLGAQYNLTKNFGTRLEYTNYGNVTHGATNGDLAMSTITLGVLYSF